MGRRIDIRLELACRRRDKAAIIRLLKDLDYEFTDDDRFKLARYLEPAKRGRKSMRFNPVAFAAEKVRELRGKDDREGGKRDGRKPPPAWPDLRSKRVRVIMNKGAQPSGRMPLEVAIDSVVAMMEYEAEVTEDNSLRITHTQLGNYLKRGKKPSASER